MKLRRLLQSWGVARGEKKNTRVGVYVDAYNLYYGARGYCGKGTPGWRWLDIESLASEFIDQSLWPNAEIQRIVYCTALRETDGDESSKADQQTYLDALIQNPKLVIEYGHYQPRHGQGLLVWQGKRRKYVRAVREPGSLIPDWIPAYDFRGPEGRTNLRIHYESNEEKGSDVNLGAHLLIDLLDGNIDAAIVITNDGDLRFPLKYARQMIPVGLVNPNDKNTSHHLRGEISEGAGKHWWRRLDAEILLRNQMPEKVGNTEKPNDW